VIEHKKDLQLCVTLPLWVYGDSQEPCTCAPALGTKYQKRISDPLLERIDTPVLQATSRGAALTQLNLSARAYHRILKLARTIADLARSEEIQPVHLTEALHTTRSTEVDVRMISFADLHRSMFEAYQKK
jgi:predicted ATPase with chaperone activity